MCLTRAGKLEAQVDFSLTSVEREPLTVRRSRRESKRPAPTPRHSQGEPLTLGGLIASIVPSSVKKTLYRKVPAPLPSRPSRPQTDAPQAIYKFSQKIGHSLECELQW